MIFAILIAVCMCVGYVIGHIFTELWEAYEQNKLRKELGLQPKPIRVRL